MNKNVGAKALMSGTKVCLRPVTGPDLALLECWDQDPEIEALMGRRFTVVQPTEWLRTHLTGRGGLAWMVEECGTGRPVGELELANLNRRAGNAEVRICLGEKEIWGHGYGREALTLALRFAFVTWRLRSVHLRVYTENVRAIRLYERIGFRKVGITPPSDRRGDSSPILLMELAQERWQRLQEEAV
ncbi:MAG TPA: GNAT family protein [Symbiobacteriaceae bacterium]|nr:GNAT family protein [Symbiobacteriaceae bacterium]